LQETNSKLNKTKKQKLMVKEELEITKLVL